MNTPKKTEVSSKPKTAPPSAPAKKQHQAKKNTNSKKRKKDKAPWHSDDRKFFGTSYGTKPW